ncbi:enoyl-CoA hydratase [Alkalicoccus saliphilus]|jgi:enoyl-CoA hydratase|uniref:Enoyl-CoA hydratase n=2 Tax=Alkalicoccus saliphilus TaxID=200989 RepID=A0A2T4U8I4_9BACI|nr:enoyl-CoA hydratase [Alkalicoccus saliphilus]
MSAHTKELNMKLLKEETNNGLMIWKINRPEAKNAVDFEVIHLFEKYLDEIENRKDIRALIITGSGGSFCSGGDLEAFHGLRTAAEARTMLLPMNKVLRRISSLSTLVITYVDGAAVGGGAELASAGDLIYVSPRTSLGFIQGKLSLTTGWGGAALAKEKVGYGRALKMLVSAERINSEKLLQTGFADGTAYTIDELIEKIDWPVSAGIIKKYKHHLKNYKVMDNMEEEAYLCSEMWESEEHHHAVESFLRKKNEGKGWKKS